MTDEFTTPPLPPEVTERTIFEMLERNARRHPNRLALVAESGMGGQFRLTYAQLLWSIHKAADALRLAGVRQGDHVGLLLNNTAAAEFVLAAFGTMRLGAVVVPLNTRYAEREQTDSIARMDCRVLIYQSQFGDTVRLLRQDLPAVELFIEVGSSAAEGTSAWSDIYREGRAARSGFPTITEHDLADILLTSGTTSRPKGVMLTHANAVGTGIAIAGALGLGGFDVYQAAFPLFTSSGAHFSLMAVFWAGATAVIEPQFQANETLARMTAERATVYVGVPAAYIFMMDVFDPTRHDVSSIRVFDYGGAPMARDVIRRLSRMFPGVELRQTYGLTEAGPTGTFLPGEMALPKLGPIGRNMPLCDVRCLGADLTPVTPGEVGEIVMRGPTIMRGYYKDAKATAETLHDGWLWTGDLGTVDEDGYLYYVDRNKDIIIRGGFNISSMEVENALFEHPDVQEVAVVAIPHPKLGEDVFAFVVAQKGAQLTVESLREFCKERLADYKTPRRMAFIDMLPRNPTGKVQKNVLRRHARSLVEEGCIDKPA